jgi:hypothetical protein
MKISNGGSPAHLPAGGHPSDAARLLDGDDVDRPNRRLASQQFAGDAGERPGDGAVKVRGPGVFGLEGVEYGCR